MGVILVDVNAAPLSEILEAPRRASEGVQSRDDGLGRDVQRDRESGHDGRVCDIVRARDAKGQLE